MPETLFVTTEPLDSITSASGDEWPSPVLVMDLSGVQDVSEPPAGWTRLTLVELAEPEELRQQFLRFLELWPTKSWGGKSFDELFTRDGHYSVWWTSVGADREVTHGIFKYFRYAAWLDRAVERLQPSSIRLATKDSKLAALVYSRAARSGLKVLPFPGAAGPARVDVTVGWVLATMRSAVKGVFQEPLRALRVRRTLRDASLFQRSHRPTIVFASRFERYLEIRDKSFSAPTWEDIARAIKAVEPAMEFAYLPWRLDKVFDVDESGRQLHQGSEALRGSDAPLLIRQRYSPFRQGIPSAIRQIADAWSFFRLARQRDFRQSFQFADADLSSVLLPDLKEAFGRTVEWSFRRAQSVCALRSAGNVKAVILSEEMYRPAMPILAAANDLGLPTIGVQHGTVMPLHTIYRVPPGHVRHAPVPGYFAAFSEYAKTTLSELGSYPAERVWVTGAARLDALVANPLSQAEARTALGLPGDKKVVVMATQTFPWFAAAIRALLLAMCDHPDAILCIKKHPSDRAMPVSAIQALAKSIGTPDVRSFDGDIEKLLFACDVWVSASSTTILEATLIGKTTICVNFTDEPDGYPYIEDGASLPARSTEQMKDSLRRALAPNEDGDVAAHRALFLRKHAGPTADAMASATFARRVIEVIGRSEPVRVGHPQMHWS